MVYTKPLHLQKHKTHSRIENNELVQHFRYQSQQKKTIPKAINAHSLEKQQILTKKPLYQSKLN